MKLTRLSKEIIDLEYEKISLIAKYLKDCGHKDDFSIRAALTIYSKRHKDIDTIDEDDYD